MTSITIHKLDKELEKRIRSEAKKQGLSLNQTIQETLRKAFGIEKPKSKKEKVFKKYCGIWKPSEIKEFKAATEVFERIDTDQWL